MMFCYCHCSIKNNICMKIKDLIAVYKSDYAFLKLALGTQKQYSLCLNTVIDLYGNRDVLRLGERDLIFEFKKFISLLFLTKPRKAKHISDVFRLFCKWSYRNGMIRRDVTDILNLQLKYKPKKINVWSEADVEFVLKNASKSLQDFIFLSLETGLRRCDLIALKFSDIQKHDNRYVFVLKQKKTQRDVLIPLSSKVIKWLNAHEKLTEFLLNSADNTPWHEDKFTHAWGRLKKRLNLKNITPHGLRKTAVTRLAKAGCSILEISAILGWSVHNVQAMLDNHYFQDKLSVAFGAIDKINKIHLI
jgi:integrase